MPVREALPGTLCRTFLVSLKVDSLQLNNSGNSITADFLRTYISSTSQRSAVSATRGIRLVPILKFILTLVGCLCGKRATRLNEIQSPEQFRAVIDREMSRADRCRSHFSLVAFKFAPANREQAHSHMQRLLSDIHNRIRCTDYAGWMGEDELGMLIIDCSTEQVNQLS
jgi:hypothetical protein